MGNRRQLRLDDDHSIPLDDIELTAVRAQGPGGQHVNKTSSAIQLQFDIRNCAAFDDDLRARLLAIRDRRISRDGVVTIKAQRTRSQDKNRQDALNRLAILLQKGLYEQKPRKRLRPSKSAKKKRLDDKSRRGRLKALRRSRED